MQENVSKLYPNHAEQLTICHIFSLNYEAGLLFRLIWLHLNLIRDLTDWHG